MSHTPLLDASVWQLLLMADRDLAAEARAAGCSCGGVLHSARYPRKPRGGVPAELRPEYCRRESRQRGVPEADDPSVAAVSRPTRVPRRGSGPGECHDRGCD
jgi:hypothetical protein